jgi:hypothetical protein
LRSECFPRARPAEKENEEERILGKKNIAPGNLPGRCMGVRVKQMVFSLRATIEHMFNFVKEYFGVASNADAG